MIPHAVPVALRRVAPAFVVSAAAVMAPVTATAEPLSAEPPRGTYVWVPEYVVDDQEPSAARSPHILYLNRCQGGLTVTSGWPDDNTVNRSGILSGTVNFPEFSHGDAVWNQVVEETKDIFSPFNVIVTDQDPSPTPHDEAVVCGSGSQAGFGGAGGVAPFTCGVIDAPITFTFPDSLGNNARTIAEVIAQEAAHAWGLEHEYKCEDPMSYLYGCGEKSFQDGDYPCGEYSAQSCECGGATQNSFQYIIQQFGPAVEDLAAPEVTITSPADGDVFAVGEVFDIAVEVSDDVGVTYLGLYLDGALATEALAPPWGPWPVLDLPPGTHEIYIDASDLAGNVASSMVVVIDVTPDGAPPPGDDDDDAGGDGDGGDGDGDGDGDDGSDAGGDADAGGQADAGDGFPALPAGYGFDEDGQGCSCRTQSSTPPVWWALSLLGFAAVRRRRAHEHRG